MSGRAGRRGKDERGIVVLVIDERMNPTTAKEIVKVSFSPRVWQMHDRLSL